MAERRAIFPGANANRCDCKHLGITFRDTIKPQHVARRGGKRQAGSNGSIMSVIWGRNQGKSGMEDGTRDGAAE